MNYPKLYECRIRNLCHRYENQFFLDENQFFLGYVLATGETQALSEFNKLYGDKSKYEILYHTRAVVEQPIRQTLPWLNKTETKTGGGICLKKYYKVLLDGKTFGPGKDSRIEKDCVWSLPTKDKIGEWMPVPFAPIWIHQEGYHLTTDPLKHAVKGCQIFAAQFWISGYIGDDISCFPSVRLLFECSPESLIHHKTHST